MATRSYAFEPYERAKPWMEKIKAAEDEFGIPRNLLARLIDAESSYRPEAIGPETKYGRATGIAQIMPSMHPGVDPTDPDASIKYSAKYLRKQYDRFKDWDKATAAYNMGPNAFARRGMGDLPRETRKYTDKISGFTDWYAQWAQKTGINKDPDDPKHFYDYRAAYDAGAFPTISPQDNKYHWPSEFKKEGHPNLIVAGVNTKTGKPVDPFDEAIGLPSTTAGSVSAPNIASEPQKKVDPFDEAIGLPKAPAAPVVPEKPPLRENEWLDPGLKGKYFPTGLFPNSAIGAHLVAPHLIREQEPGPMTEAERKVVSFRQERELPLLQKLAGWMKTPLTTLHFPSDSKAKAANIVNLADATGATPTEVLRHYDEIKRELFPGSDLSARELAGKLMTLGVVAGLASHPLATAVALGLFFGLDEAENAIVSGYMKEPWKFGEGKGLSDLLGAEGLTRDAVDLLDFMWKAAMIGGPNQGKVLSKWMRQNFPKDAKTAFINNVARNVKQTGKSVNEAVVEEATRGLDETMAEAVKKKLEVDLSEIAEQPDLFGEWIKQDIADASGKLREMKQPKREIADEAIDKAMRRIKEPKKPKEPPIEVKAAEPLIKTEKPELGEAVPQEELTPEQKALQKKLEQPPEGGGPAVEPPPKPPEEPPPAPPTPEGLAEQYGLSYEGQQEIWREGGKKEIQHLFTDPLAGNTSYGVTDLGELSAKIESKRAEFAKRQPPAVPPEPPPEPPAAEPEAPKPKKVVKRRVRPKNEVAPQPSDEPIEPVDETAGRDLPVGNIYRQSKAETQRLAEGFKEAKVDTPEAAIRLLINEANRWADGEEVDIAAVRAALRRGAAEVRDSDLPKSFQEYVANASKWVATLERDLGKNFVQSVEDAKGAIEGEAAEAGRILNQQDLEDAIKIKLMEDFYGKSHTELTEQEIEDFILGKAKRPKATERNWDEEIALSDAVENWFGEKPTPGMEKMLKKYGGGTELYSGVDLAKIKDIFKRAKKTPRPSIDKSRLTPDQRVLIEAAERADEALRQSEEVKRFNWDYFFDRLRFHSIQAIHEKASIIRSALTKRYGRLGWKIVQYMDSEAGGGGYGQVRYEQMMKEAYDGLDDNMVALVNAITTIDRLADIASYKTSAQYKMPPNLGRTEQEMWKLFGPLIRKATPEQWKLAKERSKIIFQHHKDWVDDMVASGLKSFEEGEALKAHDYRKTRSVDVKHLYDVTYKKGIKVGQKFIKQTDSGVDPLGHGGLTMLEIDERILSAELANRIYRRIANNDAKNAWADLAKRDPENPYVWYKGLTKTVGDHTEKIPMPKGWIRDFRYVNGKKQAIYFHPDVARQIMNTGPEMSYRLREWAGILSGAKATRFVAVGGSAAWATIAGFMLDVTHTYFSPRTLKLGGKGLFPYQKIFSSNPLIFAGQLGRDMADVASDAFHRGPKFRLYAQYGGIIPFLTQRESSFTARGVKLPGRTARILDLMSYHGKSMELWNRMAVMNRELRFRARQLGISLEDAYKIPELVREAVHVSRERMPYAQGGWAVKSADVIFPFTSAGYTAGKTSWRSLRENPVDAASRISWIMGSMAGLTIAIAMMADDVDRDVPPEVRDRNIVIPLKPFGFTDPRTGDKRWPYFKIPVDSFIGFFANLGRGLTQKILHEIGLMEREPDYAGIVGSLKKQMPMQSTLPPNLEGFIDYTTNYSLWKDRPISGQVRNWPNSKYEGQEDPKIPQLAKDIGNLTGGSPRRMYESGRAILPYGNEYLWLISNGYEWMFNDTDPKLRQQHWIQSVASIPGVNRLIGITSPRAYRKGPRAEMFEQTETDQMIRNDKVGSMAEAYYWHDVGDEGEIDKYIESFENEDVRTGLKTKANFIRDIKFLPHRDFWNIMFHRPPEDKAEDFFGVWKVESSPKERQDLFNELDTLARVKGSGYNTKRFKDRLDQLMAQDWEESRK